MTYAVIFLTTCNICKKKKKIKQDVWRNLILWLIKLFTIITITVTIIFIVTKIIIYMTRNQINDTFMFQNRVKVKVVGEVSEKLN